MSSPDQSRAAAWYLVLVFALLTLGIMAAGYLYYQKQRENITDDKKNDLTAIADMKMNQVDAWRKERLADARMIYENRLLALRAHVLLTNPLAGRLEDELPGWLGLQEKGGQYATGFLFDADGVLRCRVHDTTRSGTSDIPPEIREVLKARTIGFSDLQLADSTWGTNFDLLVPLILPGPADTVTVGLLVLRVDPVASLYPMVQTWPLPSRTAETLLLRQRGDVIQYLNTPIDLKGIFSEFRISIGADSIPAAMFVHGAEPTLLLPDYRGVPVLATLRMIPNSSWSIVLKVDLEEIHAPVREHAYLAIVLVTVLMLAAWANVAAIWRRQRAEFYRKQFEAEVERHALEKHHAFLTKYANDIIILMDENLSIQDANDRALAAYGYSRKELFALNAAMLHAPEARQGFAAQVETLKSNGAAVVETVHQRKDGGRFPVESSSRVVRVDNKMFFQSITRDITQRKRIIERQAAIYRISEAASATENPADLYRSIHRILNALMPAENFYIALYDADRELITFPYFVDQFDQVPSPHKPGRGLTGYVLRTGRPLLASPKVFDQLVAQGEVEIQGAPSVDWLGVPLKVEDRVIGVMAVQSYTEGVRFGKEEMDILSFVSNQVALTVERKQAEEALRQSETRYRRLVEQLPAVTYVVPLGDSNSMPYISPQIEHILGYAPGQLHPHSPGLWYSLVHADDREATVKMFQKSMAEQKPFAAEYRLLDRMGNVVWMRDEAVIVHDGNGIPLCMQGLLFDITDRKQAETDLYHSKQMLQLVLDTIPQRVFWKNRESRYLGCNRSFAADAGLDDPNAVFGRTDFELSWPQSADGYRADDAAVMENDTPRINFEEMLIRSRGESSWVRTSKVPLHDPSGNVIGVLGTYEDITERKQQEESLRKLLRAVEQTDEVIFMTEVDGTITFVNPAFENVYGFTSAEVLGKTPRIIKSGTLEDAYYRAFWSELLAGKNVHGELVNKSKDGRLVRVEASVNPVFGGDGTIVGFIAVQEDITERKNAEEERRNLEAQVVQMQKMESIGTLAGGVAHDFNNILGIVLGHCSLLEHVMHDPVRVARSLEAVEKAVQRGASLVRQILTFARKTDVLFEQVRLGDVITEFVKMVEETFPKTITFQITLENTEAVIDADRTQLHQTLLNLCVNARDAMANGGTISITMEQYSCVKLRERFPDAAASCYERLRVTDTGSGMDEATRQRIFEPFFTTKAHGKGTGLGLAVVYGIIKSHQGFIEVESEQGKGTTFNLYFPLHGEQGESMTEVAARKADTVAGGQETVLVVEDEDMLREILCHTLEGKGYRVLTASDGEEAIEMYVRYCKDIAVVVTDLGLPRMSGADTFAEIRKINPSARIILASGYIEPHTKSALMAGGARTFIQKPYVPADVLHIVRTIIDAKE